MDLNFIEHIKESVVNLCPIIATVNWKRRATDDKNGTNPYVNFFLRSLTSIIVAGIIGVGSGLLSSYILIQKMEVNMGYLTNGMTNLANRIDHVEDRFNRYMDSNHRSD